MLLSPYVSTEYLYPKDRRKPPLLLPLSAARDTTEEVLSHGSGASEAHYFVPDRRLSLASERRVSAQLSSGVRTPRRFSATCLRCFAPVCLLGLGLEAAILLLLRAQRKIELVPATGSYPTREGAS